MENNVIISHEKPTHWAYDRCVEQFGVSFDEGVVFTIGNTIYAKTDMSEDLLKHELTHVYQQSKMGVEEWWHKYLKDPKFRFEQELQAYRIQYKHIEKLWKDRNARVYYLHAFARALSSPMYGNLLNFHLAVSLIKYSHMDYTGTGFDPVGEEVEEQPYQI